MAELPCAGRSQLPRAWVRCVAVSTIAATLACADSSRLSVVRPRMVLEPVAGTLLQFDEVVIGRNRAAPRVIAVSNIGEGTLTFNRVVIEGDDAAAFKVSSFPRQVVPGGKGEIFVRFEPTVRIQAAARLRIDTNDREQPNVTYPLAGPAREPCNLALTPPHTAFISGEMKPITVSALGTQDCTITQLFTDQTMFPFVDPPAMPFVIRAGRSTDLLVRHIGSTREPGVPIRELSVRESEGGDRTVSLSGEAPLYGCLEAFPTMLLFEKTAIGTLARKSIIVANKCRREGYVTSGFATLGFYYYSVDANVFPIRVPPLGTVEVWVTYSPFNKLGDDGVIALNTTDAGNPRLSVRTLGYAAVPDAVVFPTVLDFGNVAYRTQVPGQRSECSSSTEFVQIYSSGEDDLTVSSLSIQGDADFQIATVLVANRPVSDFTQPFTIPAGRDAKVLLQFFPTRETPADHSSRLVVTHNGEHGPTATVTLKGRAVPGGTTTDLFSQLSGPKVDILWIIDNSCSMYNKQALLIANLDHFVSRADSQRADYQMAVATTEGFAPTSGDFRLCFPHPRVISSSYADSATRARAFRCLFNVGIDGSPIEAGLAAAKNALRKAQDPTLDLPGYNQGFLRPDARLAVVAVSDEEDQSRESQQLLRDYFLSVKGPHRRNQVTVHAIAGPVSRACPLGPLAAEPGYNYYWMTQQTHGLFQSICEPDWSPVLDNLGLNVFSPVDEWDLSQSADPATIAVTVGGLPVPPSGTNGFTYEIASNSVKFHGAAIPAPGATVAITYSGLCRP